GNVGPARRISGRPSERVACLIGSVGFRKNDLAPNHSGFGGVFRRPSPDRRAGCHHASARSAGVVDGLPRAGALSPFDCLAKSGIWLEITKSGSRGNPEASSGDG